eukprot:m.77775 g.77775  ORF g.77775 m.77775 type:complete len:160 (-) comp12512_c0_seq3:3132-3611(-)
MQLHNPYVPHDQSHTAALQQPHLQQVLHFLQVEVMPWQPHFFQTRQPSPRHHRSRVEIRWRLHMYSTHNHNLSSKYQEPSKHTSECTKSLPSIVWCLCSRLLPVHVVNTVQCYALVFSTISLFLIFYANYLNVIVEAMASVFFFFVWRVSVCEYECTSV